MKKREGIKLGRPVALSEKVVRRIARERRAGRSLREIAYRLNDAGVPTGHGGDRWHASTVQGILRRSIG